MGGTQRLNMSLTKRNDNSKNGKRQKQRSMERYKLVKLVIHKADYNAKLETEKEEEKSPTARSDSKEHQSPIREGQTSRLKYCFAQGGIIL